MTVDVTILNLGGRAPGDFYLAHILRTERLELHTLSDRQVGEVVLYLRTLPALRKPAS